MMHASAACYLKARNKASCPSLLIYVYQLHCYYEFTMANLNLISINLLAFYHKCCNLIGYPTRYLFRDR